VCEEGVRSEANGLKCDSICFSLEIFAAFIPVLSSLISAVSTRNPFRLPGTPNSSLVRSYTGRAVLQGMGDGPKRPCLGCFQGLTDAPPRPSTNNTAPEGTGRKTKRNGRPSLIEPGNSLVPGLYSTFESIYIIAPTANSSHPRVYSTPRRLIRAGGKTRR
jgi:hypothetical protein